MNDFNVGQLVRLKDGYNNKLAQITYIYVHKPHPHINEIFVDLHVFYNDLPASGYHHTMISSSLLRALTNDELLLLALQGYEIEI